MEQWELNSKLQRKTDIWTPFSQISDNLYGGGGMPTTLPDMDAILRLQMAQESVLLTTKSTKAFLWLPIPDAPPAPSLAWLKVAVDFLTDCQIAGYKTYVHCTAGVSRTGLVLIAFFMYFHHMTFEEAFKFVQDKRPATWPNDSFQELLKEWEKTGGKYGE